MEEKKLVKKKQWDAYILPSFLLFLLEVTVLAAFFIISYRAHGDAGIWIGIGALLLLMIAIAGLTLSVKGIRRRSEPAGLIRLLCGMHGLMIVTLIGIYGLGAMELL